MNKKRPRHERKNHDCRESKMAKRAARFPRACPDGRSPAFLDHPYPHFRPSAYVSSWCFHRSQDANLRNTSAATALPLSVKTTAVFTRYPRLMVTSRSPAALFSARWPIDRMYLNVAKRVMFNSLAYHPTGWPSLSTTDRKTTANGRGIGRSRKSLIGLSADKRVCMAFLSLGDICSGCCLQSSWRSALEVFLSAPIRHDPTAGAPRPRYSVYCCSQSTLIMRLPC
jgi:hypothetical protein